MSKITKKEASGDPAMIGRVHGGFDFHKDNADATGFSATPEVCDAEMNCIPNDELEGVEAMAWDDLSAATQTLGKKFFTAVVAEWNAKAFPTT